MKKILKLISFTMIFSLLISQAAFAQTLSFSDLKDDYWAYEGINKLVEAKVIDGYTDGTFKPDNNITRAELVKLVNLVFNYSQKQESTSFTDVSDSEWYYEQVLIAQNAGYLNGYPDGTFKPNNNITREEFCKILDSIVKFVELPGTFAPADKVTDWATGHVNKVLSNRIMLADENNKFRATEFATRAEVSDVLAKFLIVENPINNGGATSGTGSGGSLGGSGTDGEINEAMSGLISVLNEDVITSLNDNQAEVINDITSNMKSYMSDNSHDYKAAAEKTYDKYKKLSDTEQDELINSIKTNVPTLYLIELKDFFFPDVKIN